MLRLWTALADGAASRPVSIMTTDRIVVTADLVMANAKQTLLGATNLTTPLGQYPHAVLREGTVAHVQRTFTADELRAIASPKQEMQASQKFIN
ncbi:TPA: hypothetical protein N0F65_012202 [Lagenidium giganteum]|uniref:Uncharacterized protein n=1 Tax=Lagenidium giganteum TaxID=4803 RepID=A0AAV2ZIM0_9STRA|nr:TPA: hypothetical protein N0F65_012202 [Lagenidium giganteum]